MKRDKGVSNTGVRNPGILLTEDEVVPAVRKYLSEAGWDIKAWALATEQGDDIVTEKEGHRLIVEAKGEGSSKSHTARFGSSFTANQVNKHVSRGIYRSLRIIAAESAAYDPIKFYKKPGPYAVIDAIRGLEDKYPPETSSLSKGNIPRRYLKVSLSNPILAKIKITPTLPLVRTYVDHSAVFDIAIKHRQLRVAA